MLGNKKRIPTWIEAEGGRFRFIKKGLESFGSE